MLSVKDYTRALIYASLLDNTEFADRGIILSGQYMRSKVRT